MNKNNYITLLDPSLQNNNGQPSGNLGDLIIYEAIKVILHELFPGKEIIRISTHVDIVRKDKAIINNALFTFVGGTNIITSDIRNFTRLTPIKVKGFYLFPGFKNVILFGAGWAGYQERIDWASKIYYKKILRGNIFHSVRDIYSVDKFKEAGFKNIIHTSCPSTWNLETSFINKFNPSLSNMLFTLSSYFPEIESDNKLVETLLSTDTKKIYFFPQTNADTVYLTNLPAFKNNISKFTLLNHDLSEMSDLLVSTRLNYIGIRLHGGIKCLSYNHPSIILSVDNRAEEMRKSIKLNVIKRDDTNLLLQWINNEYVPPQIHLPVNNIKLWKKQFAE